MPTKAAVKKPIKRATVKKTVAARKVVAKAAAKKTATKRAPARRGAPATGKGTRPGTGVGGQKLPRDFNEVGFVVGSHSEIIANALLEGGADRKDVNHKVIAALKNKSTAGDLARNTPSMMSSIISRMKERGYSVESSWRLVPPASNGKAKPTATKKVVKKTAAKEVAAPVRKVAVKKTVAKKVAKKVVAKRRVKA